VYELLGRPTTSPYGNAIPGLDVLDASVSPLRPFPVTTLASMVGAGTVIIRRISEKLQGELAVMERLHEAGVAPGAEVTIDGGDGCLTVRSNGNAVRIPDELARLVFVDAVNSVQ
jgi:DtxR family Mn-dependent transcriptional regulator